ncbi:MAG: hypothetical protein IID61_02625 [SAR324 cluster bacterium]|nr:hypothetical protein [SAR324 cluster bacterium]
MFDSQSIRSVTIDIAETHGSHDAQDQTAELIWQLLERNYQIYLFTSNQNHDLEQENFQHPDVEFLRISFPPTDITIKRHRDVFAAQNLWVIDDPDGLRWLRDRDLPYATRWNEPWEGKRGLRIGSLRELLEVLDPNLIVYRAVETAILDSAKEKAGGALLVGIGGPPLSGYPEFAVELKRQLQSAGLPLVELLDLSSFVLGSETSPQGIEPDAGPIWKDAASGHWLMDRVLLPAKAGRRVYFETAPDFLPLEFEPHFPLFLDKESVVLAFSEMPFVSPLAELFNPRILLEVSSWETTRRIYEMDDEKFDEQFTRQYLEHEGRLYSEYLETQGVRENARLRIDANKPGALRLIQ